MDIMGWRVIQVKQSEKLSLHLDSLQVTKGEEVYKVPLVDISVIIIEDQLTSITSKLIAKLAEYKVLLLVCNDQFLPTSITLPLYGHVRQYKHVQKQIHWQQQIKDELWNKIVKRKIHGQIAILQEYNPSHPAIELMNRYVDEVKDADNENREGMASKVYFPALFGYGFTRDEICPVNAGLNYGYTILLAAFVRTIAAKGYLPYLGVHHCSEYNHFNLGSDLMEPFRPIVDKWVVEHMIESEYLSGEDRVGLINLLNAKVTIGGKRETVLNAIEKYTDSILECLSSNSTSKMIYPTISTLQYYEL